MRFISFLPSAETKNVLVLMRPTQIGYNTIRHDGNLPYIYFKEFVQTNLSFGKEGCLFTGVHDINLNEAKQHQKPEYR